MSFWSTALHLEGETKETLRFEEQDEGLLLFDPERGFKPNQGGQSSFFSLYPLQPEPPPVLDIPRWTLLCGGIGSGKSTCGAIWLILQAEWYPNQRGLLVSNSWPQLYQSCLVTLVETCRRYNVPIEPWAESIEENAIKIANMRRMRLGTKRAFIRVLSMNSFYGKTQSARGQEIDYTLVDEGCYSPEQAFTTLDGRLRNSRGDFCRGVIASSPAGFNWTYYKFADPTRDDSLKEIYKLISCPTHENTEHVGEDYVASLMASYTDSVRDQELLGLFVEITVGRVYKYFIRGTHALTRPDSDLLAYDPALPLHLSFDFNATPCVAVFFQVRQGEIHVFKELYLTDADLYELMLQITTWLSGVGSLDGNVYVYGDASGRQRSAVSRVSAWEIVLRELKKTDMKVHRCFPEANGPIMNRVLSTNSAFMRQKLFLDLENCPELVKDLEQLTWGKDNGIDKSDALRSHLADALSYAVENIHPVKLPPKPRMGQGQVPGLVA